MSEKLIVEVKHPDGFGTWYICNELIDAIICDRVHFPSQSNRTITTKTKDEYYKNFGYGPSNPAPSGNSFHTCYHFCNIDDTCYKVLGNRYESIGKR